MNWYRSLLCLTLEFPSWPAQLLTATKSKVNSEDHSGAEHPLQSRVDCSGWRGEGHQNYDPNSEDESDSDEHSSSDEDEDLIHEMIVQNSRTLEINGTYIRLE